MHHDAKIERLGAVPLLASCGKAELKAIAEITDDASVIAGHKIITQGENLRHAYIVVDGACSVTINDEHVADIGAGEVIGEIAMFDPAPALETVTATEQTTLLVVAQAQFVEIVRQNSDLAVSLLKSMAHHFRETHALSRHRAVD